MDDLSVVFEDGVATLSGTCGTEVIRDKTIIFAKNSDLVESVNADGLAVPETEEKQEKAADGNSQSPASEPKKGAAANAQENEDSTVQEYTIQSGDTLSAIARQFYGDAGKYMIIFEANRDILSDPDTIYPGQVIRIPAS